MAQRALQNFAISQHWDLKQVHFPIYLSCPIWKMGTHRKIITASQHLAKQEMQNIQPSKQHPPCSPPPFPGKHYRRKQVPTSRTQDGQPTRPCHQSSSSPHAGTRFLWPAVAFADGFLGRNLNSRGDEEEKPQTLYTTKYWFLHGCSARLQCHKRQTRSPHGHNGCQQ